MLTPIREPRATEAPDAGSRVASEWSCDVSPEPDGASPVASDPPSAGGAAGDRRSGSASTWAAVGTCCRPRWDASMVGHCGDQRVGLWNHAASLSGSHRCPGDRPHKHGWSRNSARTAQDGSPTPRQVQPQARISVAHQANERRMPDIAFSPRQSVSSEEPAVGLDSRWLESKWSFFPSCESVALVRSCEVCAEGNTVPQQLAKYIVAASRQRLAATIRPNRWISVVRVVATPYKNGGVRKRWAGASRRVR